MNAPVTPPAGIGDNKPPLITADQLAKDFAHVEAFVAGLEAEGKTVPPVIEDDEDLALVNTIVPKLIKAARRVDTLRDETKRPYLDAGNVVQTFFKAIEARVRALQAALETRGTSYLKKKADAERARLEEQANLARAEQAKRDAEAAEAAKLGQSAQAAIAQEQARTAEATAEKASAAATAKPADLARTTTEGGTATLQQTWVGRVTNYSTVDLVRLRPYFAPADVDKAVRAFVKAGGRECAGVEIKQETAGRWR